MRSTDAIHTKTCGGENKGSGIFFRILSGALAVVHSGQTYVLRTDVMYAGDLQPGLVHHALRMGVDTISFPFLPPWANHTM